MEKFSTAAEILQREITSVTHTGDAPNFIHCVDLIIADSHN